MMIHDNELEMVNGGGALDQLIDTVGDAFDTAGKVIGALFGSENDSDIEHDETGAWGSW